MRIAIVTAAPSKRIVEEVLRSWGTHADVIAVDRPFAASISFNDLYALRGTLTSYTAVVVPPSMRLLDACRAREELRIPVVKGTVNLLSLPTLIAHMSELFCELSPLYHAERVTTVIPGMYVLRSERKLVAAVVNDPGDVSAADGYADLIIVRKGRKVSGERLHSRITHLEDLGADICTVSKPSDLLECGSCRVLDISRLIDLGLDPSTTAYIAARASHAEVVVTSRKFCRVACGVRAAALAVKYGLEKVPLYSPSSSEGCTEGLHAVKFRARKVVEAVEKPSSPLELDPKGYFIISVDHARGVVVAYHFRYGSWEPDIAVEGRDWEAILSKIMELGLVSKSTHVAYLAVELYKAVNALRKGAVYIQEFEPTTCIACIGIE